MLFFAISFLLVKIIKIIIGLSSHTTGVSNFNHSCLQKISWASSHLLERLNFDTPVATNDQFIMIKTISPMRSTPSPRRLTSSPRRLPPSPRRSTPSPRRSTPSPRRLTPSLSFFEPKCNYPKCIFEKCTQPTCLLSFAGLLVLDEDRCVESLGKVAKKNIHF